MLWKQVALIKQQISAAGLENSHDGPFLKNNLLLSGIAWLSVQRVLNIADANAVIQQIFHYQTKVRLVDLQIALLLNTRPQVCRRMGLQDCSRKNIAKRIKKLWPKSVNG